MNNKNINKTKTGSNRNELNEIIKRKEGNGSNDFSTGSNGCPDRKNLRGEFLKIKGTGNGVPSLSDPIGTFEREPY